MEIFSTCKTRSSSAGVAAYLDENPGYQLLSQPIDLSNVDLSASSGRISIFLDLKTDIGDLTIGVLNGEQSRWIGSSERLVRGRNIRLLSFDIPPEERFVHLVFEKHKIRSATVKINAAAVWGSSDFPCIPRDHSVKLIYSHAEMPNAFYGVEDFDAASNTTYILPMFWSEFLHFQNFEFEGAPAQCVSSVEWAPVAKGAHNAALLFREGKLKEPTRRGSLSHFAEEFWHGWGAKANE